MVLLFFCSGLYHLAAAQEVDPLANPPTPAFDGQTGAPLASSTPIDVDVIASDLTLPRSLVTLPDGDMVLVDGYGVARILNAAGDLGEPIAGMPEVMPGGRGFSDFIAGADFASDRRVFMTYLSPEGVRKVSRAILSRDKTRIENIVELGDLPGRRLASAFTRVPATSIS